MRVSKFYVPTAALGAIILFSTLALADPPAADPTAKREPRPGAGTYGNHDGSEQARRLEEALERYREIQRRGGWRQITTDRAMGEPYTYDCVDIMALENRLFAEGYLRKTRIPPLPPPLPPQKKARWGAPPPPPPVAQPARCAYGPTLTAAMQAFQADRKVLGNGQLGRLTKLQLNRPVEEIIEILEQDVARWRSVFLPPGGTYLLVNIPFYELGIFERGSEIERIQVIVGQPTTKTPLFHDELEYIILNPDWGIPTGIAKNEYWPTARRDPNYLRNQGIVANGSSLRQKPGPNNPLGRIKFVMPNEHDVYLHDTPYKRAFTAAVGALSHGCVRLSRPMDLANYLLRDEPQWGPSRLQSAVASRKTMQINLKRHMPVYIIYSTSRVNDEGRVELRPDVYGKNRRRASYEEPEEKVDEAFKVGP